MEKLKENIEKIVSDLNYYLYDMEYVKENKENVLRIMIENDTEIDIEDCVIVSRAISEFLDQNDPFVDPYNLEVTSPGAERELRTSEEIKRAVGKQVYIETVEQKIEGEMISYKDGFIEIKYKNKRTTKINEIDVNFIRLAIVF